MGVTGKKVRRNQELLDMVASNIVYFRNLKGLSQNKLASLATIEVKNLWRYENGLADLNLTTLGFIAEGLEISPDLLLKKR